MAQKTGINLRLVHVCDPWLSYIYTHSLGYHTTLGDVSAAIETSTVEIASNRLDEVINQLGSGVTVEKNVISSGSVAESLAADALVSGTWLTLMSFRGKANWLMPAGWSTALALMHASDTPVMIVPEDAKLDLSKNSLELLLADDLVDTSQPAVEFGFDLARRLPSLKINHLHVCGVTAENLGAALEQAIATSHSTISNDVSSDSLLKDIDMRLANSMQQRAAEYLSQLDQGSKRYQTTIRNGEVREELNRMVEKSDPDLLVFGRHQSFHRKPFLLGRIPFHVMLSQGRAVVMVPNPR